jgi:negative regulator of sigma E activity
MANDARKTEELYNLDGGPRHVVVKDGVVKAVAPGLRLVPATAEEEACVHKDEKATEPLDYGLPV